MREIKVDARQYEEIKVGAGVFKVDKSDRALEKILELDSRLPGLADEIGNDFVKLKQVYRDIVNILFLDAPYDELYTACGESTLAVGAVIRAAKDVLLDAIAGKKGK